MQCTHAILDSRHHFARYGDVQIITLSAAKDRPPIASSSGTRPADTSFCMELRIVAGSDGKVARIFPRSTAAPSATATAQASPTADSSRARHAESAKIPCLSMSLAVPVSANGPRNASLLHRIVFSSA